MRDFTTKVNDTAPLSSGVLDAGEFNSLAAEAENAVSASGIALDPSFGPDSSTQMLAQAMTRHVGAALACTDSGATNAYVLEMIGNYVAPGALVAELRVRFRPGHSNSGASTVNAFSLGSKPLLDHALAPLSGGELETGRDAEIIYRPSVGAGSWVLPAWSNALYVDPDPAAPTEIGDGEGWSVNAGSNTGNLNFPGLTNNATLDSTDVFARHKTGLGHRGITGAQLLAAVASSGSGGIRGVQYITSSGTYTKTAGTNKALVFVTGGGGGGGGGISAAEAGGGGGGGTAIEFVDLTGVSTVACTIGAGGAGGVGADGSAGGTTAFGSYAAATGGIGGRRPTGGDQSSYAAAVSGGVGTIGMMRLGGEAGGTSHRSSVAGANGGSSFWGGGGRGGSAVPLQAPEDGRSPGAGGGGGDGSSGIGYNQNGAAGAAGCILVLEFA